MNKDVYERIIQVANKIIDDFEIIGVDEERISDLNKIIDLANERMEQIKKRDYGLKRTKCDHKNTKSITPDTGGNLFECLVCGKRW